MTNDMKDMTSIFTRLFNPLVLRGTSRLATRHVALGNTTRRVGQHGTLCCSPLLLLFLMLALGVTGTWAQTTDYTGYWYIASNGYVKANTTANYYLCATENWRYYDATDGITGEDNGQPFMTTYQCRNGANGYDTENTGKAVWYIEKYGDYYYIKRASDGKYLTHNSSMPSSTKIGANRIRLHLEGSADPAGADKYLFSIVANGTAISISPKAAPTPHIYLNVNKGNQPSLTGSGNSEGGVPLGGTIGVWQENTQNSLWYIEPAAVDAPEITNNYDGTFTITAAARSTIYYTTDNSIPTTSEYTGTGTTTITFDQTEGLTVIKAIAKGETDIFSSAVATYELPKCERPVITVDGDLVDITCATEGAAIHYTTDGTPATSSSPTYSGTPFAKTSAIRAIATKLGYANSTESKLLPPTEVSSSAEIVDMAGNYILANTFTLVASIGTSENPFTGTIDGNMVTRDDLGAPLVAYAMDATIKNVILKDVSISDGTNVGAICNEARGACRIYNCGVLGTLTETKDDHGTVTSISSTSTISGSGYVGSIVGLLDGTSRVINCYSFATVSGGTMAAGIVGNNAQASTQTSLKTVVVNCMFYGDITGGSSKYPVYGGNSINNDADDGINPYCYFRKAATFTPTSYNRSWPAEEKNLTRFEYYRSVLNGNRKLCTWWVNGTNGRAPSDYDVKDVGIAKWVLDPSVAPYPILKVWGKYPSIINPDPANRFNPESGEWESRSSANAWEGKSYGTLSVSISAGTYGSGSTSRSITITDMDTLNCDYGYYKIQLPYYNDVFGNPEGATHAAKYGGNYTAHVVTGWEITTITGGTPGTFTEDWEAGYNFADRTCTDKDKYSESGRVFAQGGYYYVPKDVTAISITAHWGDAFYLANRGRSIDRVSVTKSTTYKTDKPFSLAGTVDDTFQGRPVYDDLQAAIRALGTSGTVYDQAIVLIGNHQVKNGSAKAGDPDLALDNTLGWHSFTIMSADFDLDNEPDYCLQLQFRHDTDRPGILPIRFDFLPVVELGLAVRHDDLAYAIGIMAPQGHFEITETAFMRTTQFEWDANNARLEDKDWPVILNGGEFDQLAVREVEGKRTNYFLIGGHLWFHRFAPGSHPLLNKANVGKPRLCAVSVVGGDFPEFYLSGLYRPDKTPPEIQGNPHCYIDGGHFGSIYGSGYDKIKGSVTFKINHAAIGEFYGGGINGSKPIGGNIDVTIDNSRVNKYCGGPKVGDMTGKTVTTHATGTTFDVFYGGGNGGNSYYRQLQKDGDTRSTHIGTWTDQNYNWNGFNPLADSYDDGVENKGYHAEYEFEVFNQSNGVKNDITQRGFIRWIQFGLTITGDVENTLTDCTINKNFYGGGNLGSVVGDVTSTLTNSTIHGSAYGGGYSASIPTFQVQDKSTVVFPSIKAGVISDGHIDYDSKVYEWTNDLNGMSEANRKQHPTYEKDGKWYCYTWNSLENLGVVTGKVTMNIDGNTLVEGNVYNADGTVKEANVGGVFGGGDASGVIGDTEVNVDASGQKGGYTYNSYNVFGGGNEADITGSTVVNMKQGVVNNNIYGGGNLADVTNNVSVNVTGGTVNHDVYGGGALANTNIANWDAAKNEGAGGWADGKYDEGTHTTTYKTLVTLTNGTIKGDAYGGGLGNNTHPALVKGDVLVTMDGTQMVTGYDTSGETPVVNAGRVFGCNNAKGTPLGHVKVLVQKTSSVSEQPIDVTGVFGGGNLADYEPFRATDFTEVEINKTPAEGRLVVGNVYGGGNEANIAVGTQVKIIAGDVKTGVYGGCNTSGMVAQDVTVTLEGGTIGTDADHTANVHGGGYGQDTFVKGNVTVQVGEMNTPTNLVVWGDVYGGSAEGHVNAYPVAEGADEDGRKYSTDKTTKVHLYAGTIHGDAYGGGLGAVGKPASVGGNVLVELNGNTSATVDNDKKGCIVNNIFGCNNANGSPKGTVTVHIYKTQNAAATRITNPAKADPGDPDPTEKVKGRYDVAAVYGGGNRAAYRPTDAVNGKTEVVIEGCDETSIGYVYGGGNAAPVPATDVTILSSYEINYLFGGGNGAGVGNPGADVGIIDQAAYAANKSTGTYGTGKAVTKLIGGTINYVYGGSNTKGNVRGGTSITMPYTNSCDLVIKEIYGAGQNAEQDGGVNMVLGCIKEMDYVYGGAKDAHVAGGITLTVTSGKFKGVFGGNNQSGTIQGPIVLNIEETGCEPIEIEELYLGGNDAAYSIYGYKNTGTVDAPVLVARTKAEYDALSDEQKTAEGLPYSHPKLNVISCTNIDAVFGGGKGSGAVMYGSPTVNLNMVPGAYAAQIDRDGIGGADNDPRSLGTIGNVYGGGNLAEVIGDATVNVGTETDVYFITEPTYLGSEGTDYIEQTEGSFVGMFKATVKGADITGNVYGGGNNAVISGDTRVNICATGNSAPYTSVTANSANVSIAGAVFGAGKGATTTVNNTTIVMGGGAVGRSVYGGGELGSVEENTNINIMAGAIGDPDNDKGGATIGNVYGGGMGEADPYNLAKGLIKGNTNVIISGGNIYHNIYGGGAYGSVGTYTYNPETGANTRVGDTGTANITITGGTIGINGKENGMVYGSSRGDVAKPDYGSPAIDKNNLLAWVYNTNVTIGTTSDPTPGPHIKGSVYGSGENGHTFNNTNVTIHSGTIGINEGEDVVYKDDPDDPDLVTYSGKDYNYPYRGNVYGGGCGTDQYDSDDDDVDDTYNPMAGIVNGTTTVLIDGGNVVRDVYGGGAMGSVDVSTSVTIGGNAVIGADGTDGGYVFAAARGDGALDDAHQAYVGASSLTIAGTSTIWGSAFGGGQNGIVKGAVTVNMTGGTVKNDVYGGGALANANTDNWDTDHLDYTDEVVDGLEAGTSPVDGYFTRSGAAAPYTYTPATGKAVALTTYYRILKATNVTMTGGTIEGNLYGGGLGQTSPSSIAANVYSPTMVIVSGGQVKNSVYGCNNINGAPHTAATVIIGGGTITNDVFGGGNRAHFGGSTTVTMTGGRADRVFGGGSEADVAQNVTVNINGGEVTHDVYGGGALANTNTGNWDAVNNRWNDQSKATYYAEVKHLKRYNPNKLGEGEYDPEEYDAASSVTGYYERSGVEPDYIYTVTSDTKAKEGIAYYKKQDNFLNVAVNGTTYKTTVSLTGGTIGNAYGGGLGKYTSTGESTGEGAVPAMVYGDVSVTVDGTKFTKETERVDGKAIPTTGRVFGCNNKNGTPKGRVDVRVKQTKRLDDGAHVKNQFEIQGVYGGGNMAEYTPDTYDNDTEFGQGTHVLIEGCDKTSIERVYGGGNASDVPFSDVVIEGSFQIGYVFGGGNGGDKINKIGSWIDNPGANVTNYTNVLLKGGTIGEAFGGSDSKGTVGGSDLKTDPDGSCELVINNIYGASKEADFDGDVNLNLSRCSGEVDKVFGGSYNANVRGHVTINITSGIYTSVYGGNDRKGTIGGNITINVEEVDDCNPIIIQNLFGGGSQADYPGVDDKTGEKAKAYKGLPYSRGYKDHPTSYVDFTSGNITINIKAATRIDRMFGGCDNAKATGNTAVNINMVKGSLAGNGFTVPSSYTGDPIPNIHTGDAYAVVSGISVGDDVTNLYTRSGSIYTKIVSGTAEADITYYQYLEGISRIDNAIGTIGFVYGGGNQGDVDGNTTVNIGTEKDITFVNTPNHLTANGSGKYDVLGAHIYGDVFGGGNEGEVTGNTTVKIGTADYSGTANFEGISIDKNAAGNGGTVYGGGNLANVLGNTSVTVSGGGRDALANGVYVFNGIFGGGYSGSVGTFTRSTDAADVNVYGHTSHTGCIGKPKTCTYGGKCTVVVSGGQIGPVDVAKFGMTRITDGKDDPVAEGWVWGGSRGLIEDPADKPDTHFKSYVNETDVTIRGTAFIQEGIIGGGEFGRVLGNTLVKIEGGQIGVGDQQYDPVTNKPLRYSDAQFIDPTTNTITSGVGGNALPECSHYPYGEDTNNDGVIDQYKCLPYDPYYDYYYDEKNGIYKNNIPEDFKPASTAKPSDGKTWIGVVYGGGSGYFPYEKTGKTGYDWCRSAGWVEGNTELRISGGHILTNAYGGNEYTDVKGKATVKMTGGTIGVPRTLEQIAAHPVTCYLFGAGKGDERTHFNLHNNVGSVEVEVTGGIIYGSVFGGAEDGHVLGNAKVTIGKDDGTGPIIGTWGTSYVDGNVFGGGRGFSGRSLVAGVVSGNVDVNIKGGTMLGSIYGGGRLASVGTYVVHTTSPKYGTFIPDGKDQVIDGDDITDEDVKHGYITVNISGGTIGKAGATGDGAKYSGNIFGGAMGRLTLLDGSINPNWSSLGVSRSTVVNITGGTIYRNVYGGGEFGTVGNDSHVTVGGTWNTSTQEHSHEEGDAGTIYGSVFGGGLGSLDRENWQTTSFYSVPYKYNPMQWAACVGNNTYVGVMGGAVKTNVYGGGELASVGVLDFQVDGSGNYVNIKKHDNVNNGFALSWPYELPYIQGGKTTVTIAGGRIGTTGNTGHVYGGGKGQVEFGLEDAHASSHSTSETSCIVDEQRYVEAFCANVRETEVNINYASTPASDDGSETECIVGSVYGGGQDGHVEGNAAVSITGGLIGQSVYGGGQGESTYKGYLRDPSDENHYWKTETEDICSWTAGKVYGNTSVNMSGGHVMVHVYGGGNLASVGKGNYSGGTDDYFPTGYGETLNGNLWDNASDQSKAFKGSGNVTVSITRGSVGTLNAISGTVFGTSDVTPTGMVFGGCRGRAAEDVLQDPRHEYAPNFYLGYVNNTQVTIGDNSGGPRIYSQVFGGGRDGHVRGNAHVIVNNGTIGQSYSETAAVSGSTKDYQFYHRGNVYGSGSGLGIWDAEHNYHGRSSGSVTRNTTVDIYGGTIYNNVYGGGALSSVGPPRLDTEKDYADADYSKCTVNISGGTIGNTSDFNTYGVGGCVYGASRGNDFSTGESVSEFATVLWTEVNIKPHPTDPSKNVAIAGNVYGGAKGGIVWKDTEVNLTGGRIYHDAYGGGQGTRTSGANMDGIAADVGGNVFVELNKEVGDDEKGCIVSNVFGCNDLNGTPKGNVFVHVFATQNQNTANVSTKIPSYHPNKGNSEGYLAYLTRLVEEAMPEGTPLEGIDETPVTAADAFLDSLKTAGTTIESKLVKRDTTNIINKANALITALEDIHTYDVQTVYGGGDLAPFEPALSGGYCKVTIDGCQTTSIRQVYGGGNAASTPADSLRINGSFLIGEAFGGGNGLDNYEVNGIYYENPGANVGYRNYMHYVTDGEPGYSAGIHGTGGVGTPYKAIIDAAAKDADDDVAKEKRQTNYGYGSGTATTQIVGGRVRTAYGGSNQKGNIRLMAISQYQESEVCPLIVGTTYGAGKNAEIDGDVSLVLDCVENMSRIFGGATNANVNSSVTLNITNGTFDQVFAGNNTSGAINGSITVNIEEKGCKPIIIGELYGGGYLAPYSVYGYKKNDLGDFVEEQAKDEAGTLLFAEDGKTPIMQRQPAKRGDTGARPTPHRDPQINVISATRIDNIYGGGYKALVIGSPRVNVNMTNGIILEEYAKKEAGYASLPASQKDSEGNRILDLGTIGNVYGGGNQADIYGNTYVDIGTGKWLNSEGVIMTEDATGAKYTYKEKTTGVWKWYDVNDAEVGSEPVPFRKAAVIDGMVFGGGRLGHVGDFTFDDDDSNDIPDGKPTSCASGTGTCYVTISNGEIGPDGMQMTAVGGPDDDGHVFGGGQGTSDLYYDDTSMSDAEKQTAIAGLSASALADRIRAVDNQAYVNNTEVTIDGTAFVKASVYGGGFDGHVLGDTHVTIDGDCQIGCGRQTTERHPASVWAADYVPTDVTNLECASWPYTSPYAPHDKFANVAGYDAQGGAVSASDGHTFYGNVFAGGSGYYPYAPGKWLYKAGWVEGNTRLDIKGGHILTNVYGGNEMTNVGDGLTAGKGKCTIRMSGGTIGVPRTLAQIDAHPVTCYLFGAGKGDQSLAFNTQTNVKEVDVEITGGRIYGSVLGGGEDGHVLGDVKMTIGNSDGTGPSIGTWGTSHVDGNVFGGGRGFSGNALTAGNVGGSIDLDIKGGTMLGSIYGGGRLGSVGYGLYPATGEGSTNYGKMRANANDDAGVATTYYTKDTGTGLNKNGRGNIDINISGGTIGNDIEYKFNPSADDKLKMPKTLFDASTNRLLHTKGGNVFAGGMGRRTDLAGEEISNWTQLGNAKSTTLTIGGTAKIKGNVYGGGEFGAVTSGETSEGGTTTISIQGGEIGTQIKDSEGAVKYTFGSVFGGGYGTEDKIAGITAHTQVNLLGALVTGNTTVGMSAGHVWASVLGGGELAAVGGNATVTISGGEIGKDSVRADGYVLFGSSTMGNVYGGGMGKNTHTLLGVVKGNTTVNINPGAVTGEPKIYHNVYGGGALSSVGTFIFSDGVTPPIMNNIPKGIPYHWVDDKTGVATVNIKGGTIGISGRDNGMVNGSSRGDIAKPVGTVMGKDEDDNYIYVPKDPYDKMAWVQQSIVNIGENATAGPHIKGSVYGGGENGHVFTHATVNVKSGTIGIVNEADPWYSFIPEGMAETDPLYATYEAIEKKAWATRGNVYGAGCGTDTYTGDDGKEHHNTWAGCVIGNTDVNISGGWVAQSVYGGGSLGSVGRILEGPSALVEHREPTEEFALSWPVKYSYDILSVEDPVFETDSTGKAVVNITGGRIGTTGSDNGDVFGGSRGEAGAPYVNAQLANVRKTEVTINYGSTPTDAAGLGIIENYDKEDKKNKFSLRVKDEVNAICGSVYGGAENGHVNEDTKVTISNGLIGHSVYGGGKGKGTYTRLKDGATPGEGGVYAESDYEEVPSLTAGKVFGNTQVIMTGGHVVRNIYGGGNLGSVGKGNYAIGDDDYYYKSDPAFVGYGERTVGNLWTSASTGDNAWHFMNSGKTDVKVKGGVVGFMLTDDVYVKPLDGGATTYSAFGEKSKLIKVCSKDDLPTGNVFGGCRGVAAAETMDVLTNPYLYLGYVNEAGVTIGDGALAKGPRIYGSVYGGGQDGHVRRGTNVTVNKGEIGIPYDEGVETPVYTAFFGTDLDNLHWLHRGNVYGAGSGIGKYDTGAKDGSGNPIEANSSGAGSVTHTTSVTINHGINGVGGTEAVPGNVIYRNVYGGGSLASVVPPSFAANPSGVAPSPDNSAGLGKKCLNSVTVSGNVGVLSGYAEKYGGEVYGGSRGNLKLEYPEWFALSAWTHVKILNGATIMGNVFGGGDAGKVIKDTKVEIGEEAAP